jgi:hypothetical protein
MSSAERSEHFCLNTPIIGEAAASIKPADGSLHYPALGKHGKTLYGIWSLYDFHFYFPLNAP